MLIETIKKWQIKKLSLGKTITGIFEDKNILAIIYREKLQFKDSAIWLVFCSFANF